MLDGFNTERYTIVFQKTFKITVRNLATTGGQVLYTAGTQASGQYNIDTTTNAVISRATRIVRVWIPGSKLTKNGKLQYEDASTTQVKFYDYNLVLYAYSNYSTLQDIFYVSRVNDYIKTLYYTDA